MRSRYRSLLAILMLSGLALPAAASDLDRLSVFVALDPWSLIGVDYRSRHHYDPYWYHHRHYGRPLYGSRYYRPYRYWTPRYYDHHRFENRSPRFRDRHWDRGDDRRWRDRRWRDDDRRGDRHDGRRDRRGD
jgi:hypothetical protein